MSVNQAHEPAPGSPPNVEAQAPRVAEDAAPVARSREEIEALLAGISPRRQAFNAIVTGALGGTSEWVQRHWLGVVNGLLGTYVGLAVLTPIGFALGLDGPASAVFRAYRVVCDELPSHSLFISGYQMCLCARCLAIYTTMLLTGLVLLFVRKYRNVPTITWWMWALAALPMALDGGTQLFGLRESSLLLRLVTGTLFGLGTALFTLPQIEQASRPDPLPAPAAATQH